MTWASGRQKGDSFDGEWKGDLPDGRGVYIYADGRRSEGEFKNGKAVAAKFSGPQGDVRPGL